MTHLKFLKLFSWTFEFIFEFFLSLSVSQKFLIHKRMKKNRKNSQKSTFSPKFSKINKCWFFFQKFYYSSLISLLKCLWYDFGTHTTIFDDFMKIWKSIFFTKKNNFFQKKHFFEKNINYGGPLYRRRNMNTASI